MDFGGLVDHLVHGQSDEVSEHDVDHGTHSRHGCAHGEAGEACFRNRRIEHAVFAELLQQARENFERSPRLRHILAHDADSLIAAHLLGQRLTNGLREC